MAKTFLMMDMPEDCFQCKLWHTVEDDDLCGVTFKTINPFADEPPDWCPLIPEPERMATDDTGILSGFVAGWNACLDELEGK